MRTTIYIPDDKIEEVKEFAWRSRKTMSRYFMDLHESTKMMEGSKVELTPQPAAKRTNGAPSPERPKKVIETVSDARECVVGFSKDYQLGKRGKE